MFIQEKQVSQPPNNHLPHNFIILFSVCQCTSAYSNNFSVIRPSTQRQVLKDKCVATTSLVGLFNIHPQLLAKTLDLSRNTHSVYKILANGESFAAMILKHIKGHFCWESRSISPQNNTSRSVYFHEGTRNVNYAKYTLMQG